jgi:uncharacterized phage protein (TIGR01671 family)
MKEQRQLKFRVWDKLEKRFIHPYGYQGHYVLSLNGEFQNLQNGSGGDDYVVQQFTGLKDPKGNQIFEGDILCEIMSEDMAARGGSNHIGHVYYAAGTFFLDGDGQLYDHIFSFSPDVLQDYVRIGNIFETPELIANNEQTIKI